VVRPGGLELPTFWFVGGKRATQQTTPAYRDQRNQRKAVTAVGWFRLLLYPVHGQSHGQFTGRASSLFNCNQARRHGDFRLVDDRCGINTLRSIGRTSAHIPDAPLQPIEVIGFARTVRVGVRMREGVQRCRLRSKRGSRRR